MATFKDLFEKQAKQALDESFKYTFARVKKKKPEKNMKSQEQKLNKLLVMLLKHTVKERLLLKQLQVTDLDLLQHSIKSITISKVHLVL